MSEPIDLARFKECLPFTLAQECPLPNDWSNPRNLSNDAHDPGGETMCGITQREYAAYRKARGLPVKDVRKITQAEGEDIYDGSYWMPDCPTLPAGLDLCVFDASVNEGPVQANKILKVTLGITADGEWGPADRRRGQGHQERAGGHPHVHGTAPGRLSPHARLSVFRRRLAAPRQRD